MKRQQWQPAKLEHLLLDADVNAHLVGYLEAIGFDVEFAPRVKGLDIHHDAELVKWARNHNKYYVCHDRFKDNQSRLKVYIEVYEYGGRVIQIAPGPQQPVYSSLGKLLVHRAAWLAFFDEHEDGLVVVHGTGMHKKTPEDLHKEILKIAVVNPIGSLETSHRPRKRRVKLPRFQQSPLL